MDVVVAVAAAQRVVAVLTVDRVGEHGAEDRVVTGRAVEGLVLGLHRDRLEDRRARCATGSLAGVRRGAQPVEARIFERRIPDDDALAAAGVRQQANERRQRHQLGGIHVGDVEAGAALVEIVGVVARAAVEDVVALTADEPVLRAAPEQDVVARATVETGVGIR